MEPCGQDNTSGHWGVIALGVFRNIYKSMYEKTKVPWFSHNKPNRAPRIYSKSLCSINNLLSSVGGWWWWWWGRVYIYGRHARNMAFKMSTAVALVLPTAVKVLRAFRLAHGVRCRPFHMGFHENDKVLACFYVICYAKRNMAGRNTIICTKHISGVIHFKLFFMGSTKP